MRIQLAIVTTLFFILAVSPLLAHHSIASEYDTAKAMTIRGTIMKVQWNNPHVWLTLDAQDVDGRIRNWRVELAAIGALLTAGLDKSVFDFTQTYSLEIWPALDGSAHASGRTLTFADGRTFDVSDRFPQSPVKPAN